MKAALLLVGIIITAFGAALPAGALSSLSVSPASVSVDCTGYPAAGCAVSAPVANTGTAGFTSPFTAYFVYKNTLGMTVLTDVVPWTDTQSSVSDTFPPNLPGEGTTNLGYSVSVFFVDSTSRPMGVTEAQTFSVLLDFRIDYCGVGTVTVAPPGGSPTSGTATTPGCSYYQAYWGSGTQLTVTTSGGTSPVTTAPSGGSSCPAQGPGFVCTIKVSETFFPLIEGSNPQVSQDIVWVSNPNAGSPSALCLSSSAFTPSDPIYGTCVTGGAFSLQVPTGYTWSGDLWSVQPQGSSAKLMTGNATTVNLTFSALQSKVSFTQGVAALNLVEATMVQITPHNTGGNKSGGTQGTGANSTSYSCTLNPSTNAGLDVLVVDSSDKPVSGALVTIPGASGITDNAGHALLCNFPVPNQGLGSNGQGTVTVTATEAGAKATQDASVIEGQTTSITVRISPLISLPGSLPVELVGAVVAVVGVVLPRGRRSAWW